MSIRLGSLFSGYGGLDLAVEMALGPTDPAFVSDIEPGPCAVLAHRFPDAPNLGDITKVDVSALPDVDAVAGGSPCQDMSLAGKRAGMREGTRSGLWSFQCDIIAAKHPKLVVWENVAGALSDGSIGEDHSPETHLIPLVLATALGQREKLSLFGTDYPTRDGTCVRDYIHVEDLIDAHLLALEYLKAGQPSTAFNLGNGQGFTNREIIEAARRVTGCDIPVSEEGRRPGDPATLIASSEKAMQVLHWQPRHASIEDIIGSAWRWHSSHPHGYSKP